MVINPMTAPMESFRYIFFGTGQVTGVMWASSLIWTVALLALGLSLFSKVEKDLRRYGVRGARVCVKIR